MTERARTSDGVEIAFDREGSGPSLLLVHGLGDDRELWRPIRQRLNGCFTTVALDLRGHGDSALAVDWDPFQLHRELDAVVRAARISPPLVVGHSLGGVAASTYSARFPVRGVINVDQPLDLRGLSARVRALGSELITRSPSQTIVNLLGEQGHGPLSASTLARLGVTRARLPHEALLGLWAPLLLDEPELSRISAAAFSGTRASYLSLHGSDPGVDYAAWLRALVPSAELEVWPDMGHFPHLCAVERFATLVERIHETSHG